MRLVWLFILISITTYGQVQPDFGKFYDRKDVVLSLEGDSILTRRYQLQFMDNNCPHCMYLYAHSYNRIARKTRFDLTKHSIRIYENDSLYYDNIYMILDDHSFGGSSSLSFLLTGNVVLTIERISELHYMVAYEDKRLIIVKCKRAKLK